MKKVLQYRSSSLAWQRFGNGPRLLLAFHGFGQDSEVFRPYAEHLPDTSVISIDLFGHGQSTWNESQPCDIPTLMSLIDEILVKEQITMARMAVIGFSIGSRAAMSIAQYQPHRVENLIVLSAPTPAFWSLFRFATRTLVGKAVFTSFINHPNRIIHVASVMKTVGLMPRIRFLFLQHLLINKQLGPLVYDCWTGLSGFALNLSELEIVLNENQIQLILGGGERDEITPASWMQRNFRSVSKRTIKILQSHHHVADPEWMQWLGHQLNSPKPPDTSF